MGIRPPKWADRFLQWYCREDLLEEIQGDIHELFHLREKKQGQSIARFRFIWDVIRSFRPSNLGFWSFSGSAGQFFRLLQSYFKLGVRNLVKHPSTHLINVAGMSIATGIAITSYIFYDLQVNQDEFHNHAENTYLITSHERIGNESGLASISPFTLAPVLKEDIPAIKQITRVGQHAAYVKTGAGTFEEDIAFVDPGFFEIFDFPAFTGTAASIADRNSIIISTRMARKLFNQQDPINQEVQLLLENGFSRSFTVTAVLEEPSIYASFSFDFLVHIDHYVDFRRWRNQDVSAGKMYAKASFVLLDEDTPASRVDQLLGSYVEHYQQTGFKSIQEFTLFPLHDLAENYFSIRGSISFAPPVYTRGILAILSLLILTLSAFNYVNVAVTSFTRRLREVSVRKVFGGRKSQIAAQFLVENLVLCVAILLLGTVLAATLFLPGLDSLIPMNIPFSFSTIWRLWGFMTGFLLFLVLVTGLYPALTVSKYQPSVILRGDYRLSVHKQFSKVLLSCQFLIAFVTVASSLLLTYNYSRALEADWGYEPEHLVGTRTTAAWQTKLLTDYLQSLQSVESVTTSKSHIAVHDYRSLITYGEVEHEVVSYFVDYNYFQTMGLRMRTGRWFDSMRVDQMRSVVINQAMAETIIEGDPLGKVIKFNGESLTITGITDNFNYNSPFREVRPTIFLGFDHKVSHPLQYITVRTAEGRKEEVAVAMEAFMREQVPDEPYVSYIQSEVFSSTYRDQVAAIKVFTFIGTLAIILSCLGLYGLLSYHILQKRRVISIRKIVGATTFQIFGVISKGYLTAIMLSILLGIPLGYFFIDSILDLLYDKYIIPAFGTFAVVLLFVLLAVWITVLFKIRDINRINPADNLRVE